MRPQAISWLKQKQIRTENFSMSISATTNVELHRQCHFLAEMTLGLMLVSPFSRHTVPHMLCGCVEENER
jgi:hypothetical protein